MILVDFSQIVIANAMTQGVRGGSIGGKIDLLRHQVLNSLRKINTNFGPKFGYIILCLDGKNYWRKEFFPFYKANRQNKQKDPMWLEIMNCLNQLEDEFRENLPFHIVKVDEAEGDDVIGILCNVLAPQNTLIVSADTDFLQLQRFPNISQWNPITKTFLRTDTPCAYLREHIMRGDPGDGIPNFLSPDNSFVDHIRQKSVRQTLVDKCLLLQPSEFCDETTLKYWYRNVTLIDLTCVPGDVQNKIYQAFINAGRSVNSDTLMCYFIKHKLLEQTIHITESF